MKKILPYIRHLLLMLFYPFSRYVINNVRITFHIPKITYANIKEIGLLLKNGDVILSRMDGEATNLFIKGFWKHASLYVGDDTEIEEVTPCARAKDIFEFLREKDHVCILRPVFVWQKDIDKAVRFAQRIVKKKTPYDYFFGTSRKAIYCAEEIVDAFTYAKGKNPFPDKESLGVPTYLAQYFYDETNLFELIWVSKDAPQQKRT